MAVTEGLFQLFCVFLMLSGTAEWMTCSSTSFEFHFSLFCNWDYICGQCIPQFVTTYTMKTVLNYLIAFLVFRPIKTSALEVSEKGPKNKGRNSVDSVPSGL